MSNYCSDCGQALASGAGFCAGCGAAVVPRLSDEASRTQQQGSYPPRPAYDPAHGYQSSYTARTAHDVSGLAWMIEPFRRYADFNGRSRRMEYWMFALLNLVVYIVCFGLIVAGMPWGDMNANPDAEPTAAAIVGIVLIAIWWLGSFIPSLAVRVRRLHDSDKSGWLVLLFILLFFLFSIIGWIVEAVFMLLEGTRGPNQYGEDPKGVDAGEIFR